MKLKPFLVLCTLLLLGSSLWAQQGKLSGRVLDDNSKEPIEYASVALLRVSDSSLVTGDVTDAKGTFSINVAYGTYLLRVTFMGFNAYYHSSPVTLNAKKSSVALGKIYLKPSATMMKEVQISAERTMMEYQLDKRVVNVDKNIVAGGGTASDVLQSVPSVSVDNDGNVSLRGSSHVKVLINGRPYELISNDLETLLEQIPASTVENVEVITNPSAKYDPEGMSGIINLKLKEAKSGALGLNGVVTLNLGTPLAFLGKNYPSELPAIIPTTMGSINLNYTTEKYNLFFSADAGMRGRGSRGETDIERLRNGLTASHDSLHQYNVRRNRMASMKVGMEYYFNKKSSLLFSYQLRGFNRNGYSTVHSKDLLNDGYLNYTQSDTGHNYLVSNSFNLSYVKKFDNPGQVLTADATLTLHRMHGDGEQEQIYGGAAIWDNYYLRESNQSNHREAMDLKVNYTHPFADTWKLETGYEGRMDWPNQEATYYLNKYDPSHQMVRTLDEISSTHFEYQKHIHAVFATVGGKLWEKFSLQAGLRGEWSKMYGNDINHPNAQKVDKTYWELYPTLHLSYDFTKFQSLQLSYSRRVHRPDMWDMNPYLRIREGQQLNFGNPNLDPEFTNSVELSYNLGFEKVNFFMSAYLRQANNKMTYYGFVWDAASVARYAWWMPYNPEYDGYWAATAQNLNREMSYGLELIADWQVTQWWKINVSGNLFYDRIEGTQLLSNEDRNTFRGNCKFSTFLTLPKDWSVQLSGEYESPFWDLQTKMYGHYWFDMAVKKDLWQKRLSLNIRLSDIFCTAGWGHETYNEQMNRVMHSRRLSPMLTIGFTYKINNGLKQSRKNDAMDDGEGGGEGMD